MSLPDIVAGSNHRALSLTWTKQTTGAALDLTNATLTARISHKSRDGQSIAIPATGTFVIVSGPAGTFTWTFSTADIATPGQYQVYFIATYADMTIERAYPVLWNVLEAP